MTPELFREAGQALYGNQWQSALARDLKVAHRTVRRWANGEFAMPADLWYEVKQLVKQRGLVLAALLRKFPR